MEAASRKEKGALGRCLRMVSVKLVAKEDMILVGRSGDRVVVMHKYERSCSELKAKASRFHVDGGFLYDKSKRKCRPLVVLSVLVRLLQAIALVFIKPFGVLHLQILAAMRGLRPRKS